MNEFTLSNARLSVKLLMTMLLIVIGLTYLTLVVHIWIDTEMNPTLVNEAYGGMEYIELTDHAHFYLPYYSIFLFCIPVALFMFTSFSEKLKIFFATIPFVVIIIDISSMYLIPYLWIGFAWVLVFAGTILGLSYLSLFLMNMYDLWLRGKFQRI